jgi:hypothetical protein
VRAPTRTPKACSRCSWTQVSGLDLRLPRLVQHCRQVSAVAPLTCPDRRSLRIAARRRAAMGLARKRIRHDLGALARMKDVDMARLFVSDGRQTCVRFGAVAGDDVAGVGPLDKCLGQMRALTCRRRATRRPAASSGRSSAPRCPRALAGCSLRAVDRCGALCGLHHPIVHCRHARLDAQHVSRLGRLSECPVQRMGGLPALRIDELAARADFALQARPSRRFRPPPPDLSADASPRTVRLLARRSSSGTRRW